jgi:hypothetical protein
MGCRHPRQFASGHKRLGAPGGAVRHIGHCRKAATCTSLLLACVLLCASGAGPAAAGVSAAGARGARHWTRRHSKARCKARRRARTAKSAHSRVPAGGCVRRRRAHSGTSTRTSTSSSITTAKSLWGPPEAAKPGSAEGSGTLIGATVVGAGESSSTATQPAAPFRFFSPTSFWNEVVPAGAALDPSSASVVAALDREIFRAQEEKKGPTVNTTAWSVPVYTAAAGQAKVKVSLEDASKAPALQAAWDAVPLPADARPAAGTDKHLVVWQPSTDRLWEFWHLEKTSGGWQAAWGGAMEKASLDPGVYGPEAWPGATRWWGASASSLSIAGGLITLEDLERGQINHALAIAIPLPRGEAYSAPAQRTDGWSTAPTSIPEGAHLRLEPSLDLAALKLPPFTLMLAEAAKRYGIVVRDTAGRVAFYAQDPIPTGSNPYVGAAGYFDGETPQELLATFPWRHLQLLSMELHSAG